MHKARLRFKKEKEGVYVSHLDLTRMFSRAFSRLRIPIQYTQGFNPHPYMVFGPPLSVGVTGMAEVLDVELVNDMPGEVVLERFAGAMPQGIEIIDCYEGEDKLAAIEKADYSGYVTFPAPMDEKGLSFVRAHFESEEMWVTKRTKRGERQMDLAKLIDAITFSLDEAGAILFEARVACGSVENVNPIYITRAIAAAVGMEETFARYQRNGFYTGEGKIFR